MFRFRHFCLVLVILLVSWPNKLSASGGGAPGDTVVISSSSRYNSHPSASVHHHQHISQQQHPHGGQSSAAVSGGAHQGSYHHHHQQIAGSGHTAGHGEHRSSYNLLSEAMKEAVSHEFSSLGSGSADGACHVDDLECYSGNIQDRLGMEAIRSLHRQLDDDDNGNIDLSESDDFLREELKYDSGYEKRQKAFHFNDDMHISVKELWEAWLRSEVHNWTIEQTTDWLAQSVQLPQYVDLFKLHKVTGAALPRLAVNNMHYVSNVLGIKDPIHKQKIALKAMDVVLFGPPRETGTRWKDYILVTLLLSAIIGCWYAYQQNKNAKRHLRRMAQDMEGLQRAEQSLQEMQKELERARLEQENVATEKLDLERRLKEAPSLSSSSSDLELQQLKQEIEMLRMELSRAEVELVDHCWSPPPQLQSWLQYTYELENKNHMKKRTSAEKQLHQAREACEKLRKKRTSLVGAFVSTHGKSIDDVERSIMEARTSLNDVTAELQERLHRWKQIEMILGLSIVNNNGIPYLENVLYNRNGNLKTSRARMNNSTDDLDDESVQGMIDGFGRSSVQSSSTGGGAQSQSGNAAVRDDSSNSDDGDNQSVQFFLGGAPTPLNVNNRHNHMQPAESLSNVGPNHLPPTQVHNSHPPFSSNESGHNHDESRHSPSVSSERSIPIPPRCKKPIHQTSIPPPPATSGPIGRVPLPPPRRGGNQSHIIRSQSTELVPLEFMSYLPLTHYQSTTAIGGGVSVGGSNTSSGLYHHKHTYQNVQPGSAAGTPATPPSPLGVGGPVVVATPATPRDKHIVRTSSGESETHVVLPSAVPAAPVLHRGQQSVTTPAAQPKTPLAPAHCDPQMEDTNSTDSSSIDDELKKGRRKLRFPFGKKSSNKNKIA